MDVHAEHDHAFRFACARGHLKVAKWLLALGDVDIHARNDTAFLWACEGSHFEVAKWLLGLDNTYASWPERGMALLKSSVRIARSVWIEAVENHGK